MICIFDQPAPQVVRPLLPSQLSAPPSLCLCVFTCRGFLQLWKCMDAWLQTLCKQGLSFPWEPSTDTLIKNIWFNFKRCSVPLCVFTCRGFLLHYIAGAEQKRVQTLCKQGKLLLWDIRTNDIFLLNKGNVYLLWLCHGSRKLFSNYLEVPQYTSLEVQTWLGVWRWLLPLGKVISCISEHGINGRIRNKLGESGMDGNFPYKSPITFLSWMIGHLFFIPILPYWKSSSTPRIVSISRL